MTPPRRFSGLTAVPDAGRIGRSLTLRQWRYDANFKYA
jgi:hypothetical protein